MHRFFLTHRAIHPQQTVDLTPLSHQLQLVLRLGAGDQIILLDDQGHAYLVEISNSKRSNIQGRVLQQLADPPEPVVPLTLYQCSLKTDKFEWVLQKGTELGVTRFVPVISQRAIVRPASALLPKYKRWQTILREAAEQCGRGRIPELVAPLTWDEAIAQASGLRLLPWEQERDSTAALRLSDALPKNLNSQTGSIPQDLSGFKNLTGLSTANMQTSVKKPMAANPKHPLGICLLIGPEGGITPAEATSAQAAGWRFISLGPRILRAETAALAAIAIIMELMQ